MALSGAYWPVHPKPLPDELFSSWLTRTALSNSTKVHTFCHLIWPGKQIWNRDIDVSLDDEIMNVLIKRTGTSEEAALATTISAYAGTVFETLRPNGRTRWVLPVGIYHRVRRQYGLQWCPQCLAEDPIPYFRRHWRMGFVSSCARHGLILAHRCHVCAQAAVIHRGNFAACHECGTPYSDHPRETGESVALQAEFDLLTRARNGRTWLEVTTPLHPVAYFDVWRRLVVLVSKSSRSQALRDAIASTFGGDPTPVQHPKNCREFEYLSPADRHKTIGLVARVMPGWPFRLVGACIASRNWATWVLRDMNPIGFHLWEPARRYLHPTLPGRADGTIRIYQPRSRRRRSSRNGGATQGGDVPFH